MLMVTVLFLLKPDRLEAYPTCSVSHVLGTKRSILAGLVKFLAVGCGLNEVAQRAMREPQVKFRLSGCH